MFVAVRIGRGESPATQPPYFQGYAPPPLPAEREEEQHAQQYI